MINKIFNIFKNKKSKYTSLLLVVFLFVLVNILISTGNISSLIKNLLIPLISYIIAALALNLTVGILGDLSLGQAGFMSVGGFTGAVIVAYCSRFIDNNLLVMIIAILGGSIFAGIFGLIVSIPVLKLQGDYLAIVTLAFGQIVKSLISNLYVGIDSLGLHISLVEDHTNLLKDGKMIINGPSGLSGNLRLSTLNIAFVLLFISLLVIYNILESKQGRAIMATRDNKIVALSVGIDTSKYKLMAFVVSAILGGAAGVIYTMSFSSLMPTKFDFNLSIMILVYVVLGGLGNMTGTIISTIILMLLPELLRSIQDYRMIIYALVLILIMIISNNKAIKQVFTNFRNKLFKKGAAND